MVKRPLLLLIAFLLAAGSGLSLGQTVPGKDRETAKEKEYHYQLKRFIKGNVSWLEIELEDESGRPVSGIHYVIKQSDGSITKGTLGVDGRAVVNMIPSGTCVVSFPELDMEEIDMR